MSTQKRYQTFTLRRLPFWVFVLSGVSGITLAPLFESASAMVIAIAMSIAIILTSLAARFRDIGLSAWLAPLGFFPAVALFVGLTPGDAADEHPSRSRSHVPFAVMLSLITSGSSIAYLIA